MPLPAPRVSIHAPTGGATDAQKRAVAELAFQFTRPRGARQVPQVRALHVQVSIHAPTGGATARRAQEGGREMFQFTRPRGARHSLAGGVFTGLEHVSIHAPTGGATRPGTVDCWWQCVSIHAPTGGATPCWRSTRLRTRFQFTRPRGARRQDLTTKEMIRCFNSRAHGGRDDGRKVPKCRPTASTPRTPERRDSLRQRVSIPAPTGVQTPFSADPLPARLFQFTRPRGARRSRPCRPFLHPRFNSRAHGGRDPRRPVAVLQLNVSIHAPTGGATTSQ